MSHRRTNLAALIAVMSLASAACGAASAPTTTRGAESTTASFGDTLGGPVDAESVGVCSDEGRKVWVNAITTDVDFAVTSPASWTRFSAAQGRSFLGGDLGPIELVPDDRGRTRRDTWVIGSFNAAETVDIRTAEGKVGIPERLLLLNHQYLPAVAAANAGADLLIAYYPGEESIAYQVVAAFPDGSIGWVEDCGFDYRTVPYRRWHQAAAAPNQTEAEFLMQLVADPVEAEESWRSINDGPPTEWAQLNPDLRFMEDAPQAQREAFYEVFVEFVIPEVWWTFPGALCTRIAEGWNNCLLLDGGQGGLRDDPTLTAWVPIAGGSLELWVLHTDGRIDDPIGRLGSVNIPAGTLEVTVELVGRTPSTWPDDFTSIDVIESSETTP